MERAETIDSPSLEPGAAGSDGASEEYNFDHFRTRHLLKDAQGTLQVHGIRPGEAAPDFELPMVGGGSLRLSHLRDRPTILHFGSPT